MAIDSQMLQHLAQAGMVVGRQLPVDVPVVNIKSFPTTEAACKQARQSGVVLSSEEVGDENLMRLLNLALECDNNADLLETLGNALEDVIKQDMADKLNAIDALHVVSVELAGKVRDKKPNKVLLLKTIIKGYIEDKGEVVDN
ncbi:non-specific serine,threonine protein kinase [Sarracenia purpurea var. burkii]